MEEMQAREKVTSLLVDFERLSGYHVADCEYLPEQAIITRQAGPDMYLIGDGMSEMRGLALVGPKGELIEVRDIWMDNPWRSPWRNSRTP